MQQGVLVKVEDMQWAVLMTRWQGVGANQVRSLSESE